MFFIWIFLKFNCISQCFAGTVCPDLEWGDCCCDRSRSDLPQLLSNLPWVVPSCSKCRRCGQCPWTQAAGWPPPSAAWEWVAALSSKGTLWSGFSVWFVLVDVLRWSLQFFKRFRVKIGQNTEEMFLWVWSRSVTQLFVHGQDQLLQPALSLFCFKCRDCLY